MLKEKVPGIKYKYGPVPWGSVTNKFYSDINCLSYFLSARNLINKSYTASLSDLVSHPMAKER